MSGYNIDYFLQDFADRTIKNLKFIEANKCSNNLYEVTQLINSLLGLIVIPVEASKRTNAKDKILKKASEEQYNTIYKIIEKCKLDNRYYSDYSEKYEKDIVNNFIRHLRNSIAHGGNKGIHFYPINENGVITHVIFHDESDKKQNIPISNFCIKLSVSEIRVLVIAISELYCKYDNNISTSKNRQNEYNKNINEFESLMKKGR